MGDMTDTRRRTIPARRSRTGIHRSWWVAVVIGLVILVTGWSTGMPGMLTDPLREAFGWSRNVIGFAFAVNIFFYGLTAPFAAALMDRFGIRRVITGALTIMAAGAALTALMARPWQLVIGWGVLVGLGTGSTALTFAATVTSRWFVARRGLVSGVLTSANMLGGMALMPVLAWLVGGVGWSCSPWCRWCGWCSEITRQRWARKPMVPPNSRRHRLLRAVRAAVPSSCCAMPRERCLSGYWSGHTASVARRPTES